MISITAFRCYETYSLVRYSSLYCGPRLIMTFKISGRMTKARAPTVQKLSERDSLYPLHDAMDCSTLLLNDMRVYLSRFELAAIGSTPQMTSLAVLNSSYYDDTRIPRIRCGDPQYIPPPFLFLSTLSLDRSDLGRHLLRAFSFPAVAIFELIPDTFRCIGENLDPLILTALLRFPSLTKIIVPLDFWVDNATYLRKTYGESQIRVELARKYQWNWLKEEEKMQFEGSGEEGERFNLLCGT